MSIDNKKKLHICSQKKKIKYIYIYNRKPFIVINIIKRKKTRDYSV